MGDIRIIGIFGNLGCYKTALMVALARQRSRRLKIPIVANFKFFKTPNARYLEPSEMVGGEYVDTIICQDEVYALADSRCSMSTKNIFYTYSVAQARKSPHVDGSRGVGNFLFYTAQLQSMADCRLFDLTNLYIMMDKLPNGDAEYEWVRDDGSTGGGVIAKRFFEVEAFPFYRTDEKVMPLGIESMRVEMERFEPEKLNARVDVCVDEFLKKYAFTSFKQVQRFTVEDFLRRKGVPKALSLDVFNAVRELLRVREFG